MKVYSLLFLLLTVGSIDYEIYESDITEESGDFVARMDANIGLMPKQWNNLGEGTIYTDPSSTEINGMVSDVLTPLKNSSFETAATNAKTYGYRLVKFIDSTVSLTYYILERDPSSTMNNYWGTYVFNPEPLIDDLVIQSPHPSFDAFTGKQGAFIFRQTRASFFFMSGAHRCNSEVTSGCDGTSNVCNNSVSGVAPPAGFLTDSGKFRKADMAHNDNTVFQKFTENLFDANPDYYFVQLHGYGRRSTDPHAILSNGRDEYTTPPTVDHLSTLRTHLVYWWGQLSGTSETFEVEVGHDDPDHNFSRLLGSTNTQGRYLNGSSDPCGTSATQNTGHFLHVEQGSSPGEYYIREEEHFSILGEALKSTFGDNINPVFTSSNAASFEENGTGTVYTAIATDANTVTYSLGSGNDNSKFDIEGSTGVVTFKTSPDYESPDDLDANNAYLIEVIANDGTNTVSHSVTISVTDVDDTVPVFTSSNAVNFAENGTGTVYTAVAIDANTVTYSLGTGNDNAKFDIETNTGVVTFKASPDYESPNDLDANNAYLIEVIANDETNIASHSVTISVTDVDDTAPVFTSSNAVSFAENGTGTVYTAVATDANTVTYSLGSGNDNSKFDIEGSTGVVTFKTSPDYESPNDLDANNTYLIEVIANDGINTTSNSVTITVTDVNENSIDNILPVFTSASEVNFLENGTGTVYTAVATDANMITYSLGTTGDNLLFQINSVTGEVLFKQLPDFEQPHDSDSNNEYVIDVIANDGYNTAMLQVVINVIDIDDIPPVFTSSTTVDFLENNTMAAYIAVATDVNSVSYSLSSGGDNDFFDIVSSTGVVMFKTTPDFEMPKDSNGSNDYVIDIIASDGTNLSTQVVTVYVINIEDETAPVFTSPTLVNFLENGTGGAYTAIATDANTVSFSLSAGGDNDLFEIIASTGVVAFKVTPDYELPKDTDTNNIYLIQVEATDGVNTSIQAVTISVTDLDEIAPEPPIITGISEDSGINASDGVTNNNTFSIEGTAEARSNVEVFDGSTSLGSTKSDDTGKWSFNADGQAFADGDYRLTSKATDLAGNISKSSDLVLITVDTQNPLRPTITSISDDAGNSNSDFITNDVNLIINGNAEPDSRVVLVSDATELITSETNESGEYAFDLSVLNLSDGVGLYSVIAEDLAGNKSDNSSIKPIRIDLTSPFVTSIKRSNSNPTQRSSVQYTVNFSESVYKLDVSHFDIAFTGTQDADISRLSASSGTSVTVTINNIAGEGSFGLNLVSTEGAMDVAGNALTGTFDGEVYKTNYAPTDLSVSNLTLHENNALEELIGILSTSDSDTDDIHTYSLVSGNGDANNLLFSIVGNELRAAAEFDFENGGSYSFRLQTDDGRGGIFQKAFTLNVLNVAEPEIRLSDDFEIATTALGTTTFFSVVIYNDGNADLTINNIIYPTAFDGPSGGISILPDKSESITFSFSPSHEQSYSGEIIIESNAGTNRISVEAIGTIVTSIKDALSDNTVLVFPNPATELLNVDLSAYQGAVLDIKVKDINGREYFAIEGYGKQGLEIEVATYTSGVYFLIIQIGDKQTIRKFLIKR